MVSPCRGMCCRAERNIEDECNLYVTVRLRRVGLWLHAREWSSQESINSSPSLPFLQHPLLAPFPSWNTERRTDGSLTWICIRPLIVLDGDSACLWLAVVG
jgi:hypothetical protein